MNVTPNLHNVVMIGVIAILVILAVRVAAKSPAGSVPVVGQVLRVGASA